MHAQTKNRGFLLWRIALALLLASLAAHASAQVPEPQQGSSIALPERNANPASTRPVFEFHSGFWINLHHFLYQQARIQEQESTSRGGGAGNPPNTADSAAALGANSSQSADWAMALDYYAKNFAHRDLLIDDGMVMINDVLADLETCPDLSGKSSPSCASGLRPDMIETLERAAIVYHARWWSEHDRVNRAWIEAEAPLVRNMGGTLAAQLAAVYHSPWPRVPIRVDVVYYGGPFGAYTTLDPTHITLSSADSRNQGPSGFEILFHEASHALASSVEDGIVRECHAREIPVPRDLWHALLFYTTGEIVKRAFESPGAGKPAGTGGSYTPYAYRNGLYQRGWQNYQRALETYWQPYLDGKTNFDRALVSLVAGL
jgi:hypothetical protein